ncbi:MAG: hypothetical protein IJM97_07825 [Clostridia bacterium]|nr:hypothetical protein [Clostridia bacterium]
MNTKAIFRVVAAIVAIFVVAQFIHTVIKVNYEEVRTEVVVDTSVSDTLDMKVFVAREESYITNDAQGIDVAVVEDASMVANGDVVAYIFSDNTDAANYVKSVELEEALERYEKINYNQSLGEFDAAELEDDLQKLFTKYLNASDAGVVSAIEEASDNLRDKLTSKDIILNGEMELDTKIANTKGSLEKIKNSAENSKKIITSDSGYFVSNADGYENLLSTENLEELTVEQVESTLNAKPKNVPENVMGKLIIGFNWYIVAVVDNIDVGTISEGSKYKIRFPDSTAGEITAEVESIGNSKNGKSVLILKSNLMNENLANLRIENAQLVLREKNGFKVSKEAIREVNGVKGVYIRRGNLINFRKVEIIYTGEDYVIVKKDTESTEVLKLYDSVVVRGKDIYDGKVVR